jgi:signal transduction histidine kinase
MRSMDIGRRIVNRSILLRVMIVAMLFGLGFWVADSAYGYFMFSERVRYLLFQEPLTFLDALLLNVPPYDLFVRIAFLVICLLTGLLIAHDLSRLKDAELQLRAYSENLEDKVATRTAELREAQEQLVRQETLATLGRLAGGIGHELRNPLGVISNAVYLLQMMCRDKQDMPPEATEHEYLKIIASEVDRATTIVSDLLIYASAGPQSRKAVDLNVVVERLVTDYPPPASVNLRIDSAREAPDVFVNEGQIREALGRLIVNAYQSMPKGGDLTLTLSREDPAAGGPYIVLTVVDTGHGITAENMERLFEPLFSTKTRGIGLGLAIAKNLIEANEGKIMVESRVGRGSTFTVRLPTVATAAAAPESLESERILSSIEVPPE